MPAILIDLSGYDEDASDPRAPAPAQQMTSKTATRLLYLAFGLFIVASMTFYVMQTTAAFQELTHRGEHARMPFQVDDDLFTISNLEHESSRPVSSQGIGCLKSVVSPIAADVRL